MGKVGNNLSFGALLIAIVLNIDNITGGGAPFLVATFLAILINGGISLYSNLETEEDPNMTKIQNIAKAVTPALFTTYLWVDNGVLPDYWNYLPLVITVLATVTQFLGDEAGRAKTLKVIMYIHAACQLYVAATKSDICLGIQALTLLAAYIVFARGLINADLLPFAQYNYLTAAFMIEVSQCSG